MTDSVRYAIPPGIIGRLANHLFVERMLNTIFDFRLPRWRTILNETTPRFKSPADEPDHYTDLLPDRARDISLLGIRCLVHA